MAFVASSVSVTSGGLRRQGMGGGAWADGPWGRGTHEGAPVYVWGEADSGMAWPCGGEAFRRVRDKAG